MNIQVTPHTISITINTNINAGEYNITPCEFTFTEEYEDLTKEAIFSSCGGSVFKVSILNNQCTIPYEVLQQEGNVLLGVYAYETNDDELVLRYSPTPQYFNVKKGSFQVGNDPDLPSPTEWERVLEQINQAIEETNNLNITANKEGKVTTVTITKKDGTTQEVEINDGKDLEFNWEGTSLGVRQEGQSEYEYTNLKGDTGDTGATPNIQIGDVQTGDTSEVTITGTDENPILNFTLEKGDTGNGIASITKTSTSGLVDTYTITFTNGQTTTYEITNGANGSVVDVQVDGTSVVDNGIANIIGLTEMKQELEDMYNLLPKVQGTGETITLDGTVAGKMLVDLKGNTSQYSTTGKNLCYFSNFTEGGVNFNGSEINVGNTTGSVVYIGSNFNLQDDTSKSGKTYTIYACVNGTKQTGGVGTGLSINFAKTGVPIAFQVSLASSEGSFNNRIYVGTITLGENEVFRNVSVVTNNAITANINVKVMIVEGSYTAQTIGDYEPYTNGASPNPDYPQDIHVVSGDNEIVVCGKNLLSNDITGSVSWGGTSVTYNGSEIKISKSGTGGISANAHTNIRYFSLEAGKTYTFSMNYKSGTIVTEGATYGWAFYIFGVFADGSTSGTDGNRWICSLSKTTTTPSNHITFTPDKDFIGFKLGCYIAGVSPKTNGDVYFDCQVEVGEATTYEPYQSQSYPITLPEGMFLGWIPNTDYRDKIDKSTGKNLFENVIYKDNYIVASDGTETSNTLGCIWKKIKVKPNTTYTLSYTSTDYSFGQRVSEYNSSNTFIQRNSVSRSPYTFTTTSTTEYINLSGLKTDTKIMINEGTIALDYEPYGTNWYLNKQIGKVVLDGSESDWSYPSANRFNLDNFANNYFKSTGSITYLSNHYEAFKQTQDNGAFNTLTANTNYGFNLSSTPSNYYTARFKNTNITSVDDFKTWLSTHNTIVYYVLATPTYTEITDTTLQQQLNALEKARSYNSQTNLTQTNDDKPFILDVTALKQLTQ